MTNSDSFNVQSNKPLSPAQAPLSQPTATASDAWRTTHMGCLLGKALRRFDARVMALIAQNPDLPLKWSNYAARGLITAAQMHITRHLSLNGSRLVDMAQSANMSKQAMASLVQQCEHMGWIERRPSSLDGRERRIHYTEMGLLWQRAFEQAVSQAEAELAADVSAEVATVIRLGLEAYGGTVDRS